MKHMGRKRRIQKSYSKWQNKEGRYRPNIVVVSMFGSSSEGGIERVVFYLLGILKDKGPTELLTMGKSLGKLNILIYPLALSLRLLPRRRCVIITQAWQSWAFPADYVISHGTTKGAFERMPKSKSFGGIFIMWMECVSVRMAKKVIAVSVNCKKELMRLYHVPEKKIIVVNNFVDEDVFKPQECPIDINYDRLCIVFAGRLIKRKGVDRLLKLARFIKNRKDVCIKIACNDDTNVDWFRGFSNVYIYKGLSMEEMDAFYNRGDVMYFPTRYEGFSMVTLEALSSGIPVIGTAFAVSEELRKYPFTSIIDVEDMEEVVDTAFKMKKAFGSKRAEIHEAISRDFGKKQYRERVYKLVWNAKKSNK